MSLIVNGKYIPDAKKIYDIHKFTNGEVTFIDFVTDDNGNEIGGLKNGIVKK
ncbi:MAG: hypothetical protein LBH46_00765 [Rickettsiales bacterium]|nr:hypothetical protein [Rickettsiales bacterium]